MQAVLRNEFFTLTVDTLGAEAVSLKNAAGEPRYHRCAAPWSAQRAVLLPVEEHGKDPADR